MSYFMKGFYATLGVIFGLVIVNLFFGLIGLLIAGIILG